MGRKKTRRRTVRRVRSALIAVLGLCIIASGLVFLLRDVAKGDGFEIAWVGDTFIGDMAEEYLVANGYDFPFEYYPDLASADLTVVNVEAPITSQDIKPEDVKTFNMEGSPTACYKIFTSRGKVIRYFHRSPVPAAESLARQGVDIATLANNHSLDQGLEGLIDTRHHLTSAGVACIGAGENWEQASAPYVVDTPHGRVAIFGFCKESFTAPAARADRAGVYSLSREDVDAACRAAQAVGARWKVATVHWGRNYLPLDDFQRNWAEGFARRGFDLVVGHGPHVIHPVELIGRTLVLYSIGNGLFLTNGQFNEQAEGFGLVATTVLTESGFREARLTCVQLDNKKVRFQPRLADPEDAARILADVWLDIDIKGSTGVLKW